MPVVAVPLVAVAVMTPRFTWFLVAREVGLRRAIRMEHARQEREAVGKLHWIVDHEVARGRVDLARSRVIEHAPGVGPCEVHVDVELLASTGLRDGLVDVIAEENQATAAPELRSNRHALPFLCLLTPG